MDLLYYFSDGAPSQYKNYKFLSNLYYHHCDYGIQAEWHFFATSHGKSPCDGKGGTVKCLLARASFQSTHILFVRDMFDWCVKSIDGISFLLVSFEEIEEIIQTCELEK